MTNGPVNSKKWTENGATTVASLMMTAGGGPVDMSSRPPGSKLSRADIRNEERASKEHAVDERRHNEMLTVSMYGMEMEEYYAEVELRK